MKVLKVILIIVGVLVAAILIVPLFSPATAEVSAETEIALEPAAIFSTVASFIDRYEWDPWMTQDSTADARIEPAPGYVGSTYSWEGQKVGNGRMEVISVKENEYMEAARAIGAGKMRILRIHILPNILGDVVVLSSIWIATAIRVEANLSFIGLGVSPPTPAWGSMIRDGTRYLSDAPWVSLFPGLAILITVLAFNLLGDGLRDVLDPKLQR